MKRAGATSAFWGMILLLTIAAAPATAADMGTSLGHDLDALWARAQASYDLSKQDAVVLLESRHVSFRPHSQRVTRVHRVVWVGTSAVVRTYADLRIPWNSANSEFKVLKLRTWRDGRWWPDAEEISETAVVETLPYALAPADDYSSMRETMLLHDGVEVPCIMETAYEIVEGSYPGCDGIWVFPQRDPALLVELKVSTDQFFVFESVNGAPEPVITPESDRGKTYTWTMENVEKLGVPLVAHPAAYEPHVVWASAWQDWKMLGRVIHQSFNQAAETSDALADTVAQRIADTPSPVATARAIVAYVNESTRAVHYDDRFWPFSPRPASRTWETAYGHGLDRAVLAAALLRDAGLTADPIYVARETGKFSTRVPGFSRFEDMKLYVAGDNFQAIYDPEAGTLTEGKLPVPGRVTWKPLDGGSPVEEPDDETALVPSYFEVMLDVEPDKENGWKGTGHLKAGGLFCPYGEMKGLGNESLDHIKHLAGSLVADADVSGYNPDCFKQDLVVAGFQFSAQAGEPDDRGRTRLQIGNPAGGIISRLPADVSLYDETRESPVLLPGCMDQRIRVRVKTGGREIVYLPDSHEFSNGAGSYSLAVEKENGWVVIDQRLRLDDAVVAPGAWPGLRALLLEVEDVLGRTVLIR